MALPPGLVQACGARISSLQVDASDTQMVLASLGLKKVG